MQRFVNRIIGRLDIGPSQNLVGIVQYSEITMTVMRFDSYANINDSKADIYKTVDNMFPLGDNTNTALGLRSLFIHHYHRLHHRLLFVGYL